MRAWLTARRSDRPRDGQAGKQERLQAREIAASERQSRLARRRPLARESARLEERMQALRREQQEIEAALADPSLYQAGDAARIRELGTSQARATSELGAAEERWLAIQIELEEIGAP